MPYWASEVIRTWSGSGQVASSAQRNFSPWRRGEVEDPVGLDAGEGLGAGAGEFDGELDRVVAAVEDEQRHGVGGAQPLQQATDLGGGNLFGTGRLRTRVQAHGVQRRGPGVRRPVQLRDPLVTPAGHDGLPIGVPGGVVVVPALRRALRVVAAPGRGVHREDQRPAGVAGQYQLVTQPVGIDLAAGKRAVDTAMPALMPVRERQMGERLHHDRAAQGIHHAEHRITPLRQTGVQALTKVDQILKTRPRLTAWGHTDGSGHRTLPESSSNFESPAVATSLSGEPPKRQGPPPRQQKAKLRSRRHSPPASAGPWTASPCTPHTP